MQQYHKYHKQGIVKSIELQGTVANKLPSARFTKIILLTV